MGAGIAQVSIDKGMHVILKDMATPGLARGEDQIYKGLNTKTKKRQITRYYTPTKFYWISNENCHDL